MLDNFKFETFVDAHSNIFEEYLSSVISKLRETNSEYRSIEEKIESLYRQYPNGGVRYGEIKRFIRAGMYGADRNSGASGEALRYAAGSNLFPRLL